MKKILCLLLALCLLFGCTALLASCDQGNGGGGDTTDTHTHVDANKDGKCDVCGQKMSSGGGSGGGDDGDGESDMPWDKTSLIFQMTKNSNQQELPSGCERYLAGEDASSVESIDEMIAERNAAAEKTTGVTVRYLYYPDSNEYRWGANIENIYNTVMSNDPNAPDMYCNFVYDMVATSLKGSFANLKSTTRGTGELKGLNYFRFNEKDYDESVDNLGYMYEYMQTLTLSMSKMYILASDYFTDLIRAFFAIPVNIKMLNSIVEECTGDINGDGEANVDDFYQMIKEGKWTYDELIKYSQAIYQAGEGSTGSTTLADEQVGFALSTVSGLSASGLLYTTSVVIIHNEWDDARSDYKYYYPETNQELEDFCAAAKTLFESTGVTAVNNSYTAFGPTSLIAIRERFAQNHVLFGGIICVGSLEYDSYQNMKDGVGASDEDLAKGNYGFGVIPVPLYRSDSDDIYLTMIHNVGRAGGISATTTKFAQCTAFLDYQSTHSTEILDEYYNYKLQYDVAGGTEGNVYMLQYIRSNVRTAFDKTFEDAIGKFFNSVDENSSSHLWHVQLKGAAYRMTNIAEKYAELYPTKAKYLASLVDEYDKLPD